MVDMCEICSLNCKYDIYTYEYVGTFYQEDEGEM